MQPKTEEFLYFLLWSAERLMCPTFHRLNSSYESWAYSKGLLRQLPRLRARGWLEHTRNAEGDRVYRLTEAGRVAALGGRDPVQRWNRTWDGRWRLVLFDIPLRRNAQRAHLRRYLRSRGFGCLQNSVWITPDPMDEEIRILREGEIHVESLILLNALPCAGESSDEMVDGAWDFPEINRRYQEHQQVLEEFTRVSAHRERLMDRLRAWASVERQSWRQAVTLDPLLPAALLPSGYLGQQAWSRRVEVLHKASRLAESHSQTLHHPGEPPPS